MGAGRVVGAGGMSGNICRQGDTSSSKPPSPAGEHLCSSWVPLTNEVPKVEARKDLWDTKGSGSVSRDLVLWHPLCWDPSNDLGWSGQSSGIDMTIASPGAGTVLGQLDLCIPRAATALASRMWDWM